MPSPNDHRLLHIAAYVALFCVGMYAAAFGPALPFLAEDLGVSLDTAGLLLTALFVGSIAASATVAVLLHGRDTRALCIAGLICMTVGVVSLGIAPAWWWAIAGVVVLGLGDGLVVAATHILMQYTSDDVPSAVNRLNIYFAFGAVAGPLWAGGVLAAGGDRWLVYAGIAAVALLALALMLMAEAALRHPVAIPDERFRLPGNPTAWLMGVVLFLYVGAEFGLGSWVSSYTRETADAGVFVAAVLSAGYWAALALGRIASLVYFAGRRDATDLLAIAVTGAGISSVLLVLSSGNIGLAAIAAFGAGFFFGPIWPATTAIAAADAGADATAATVTMGNSGGLAIPWLQGLILVSAGPTQGVAVTAALCGLMLGIVILFRASRRRLVRIGI